MVPGKNKLVIRDKDTKGTFQKINPESLLEQEKKRLSAIKDIFSGGNDGFYHSHFEQILQRYIAYVMNLPLSENQIIFKTDAGLLSYSLSLACKSLEVLEKNFIQEEKENGVIDSVETLRKRPQWQYATALSALFQNIGRVVLMDIYIGNQRWNYLMEGLFPFLNRIKADEYMAGFQVSKGRIYWKAFNSLLGGLLLFPSDITSIDLEIFSQMLDSLSMFPNGKNRISPIIKEARRNLLEDGELIYEVNENEGITGIAILGLLKIFMEKDAPKYVINCPGGQIYVKKDFVAVAVPATINLLKERGYLPVDIENTEIFNLLSRDELVIVKKGNKAVWKVNIEGIKKPLCCILFRREIFPELEDYDREVSPIESE